MLFQRKLKFVVKFNDLIHFQNDFSILPDLTKAAISCFERWTIQQNERKLWKRASTFHDPINSQWIKSIFALPPLAKCLFSPGKSYYLSEMGDKHHITKMPWNNKTNPTQSCSTQHILPSPSKFASMLLVPSVSSLPFNLPTDRLHDSHQSLCIPTAARGGVFPLPQHEDNMATV